MRRRSRRRRRRRSSRNSRRRTRRRDSGRFRRDFRSAITKIKRGSFLEKAADIWISLIELGGVFYVDSGKN
jgi:hypothetical protein